jgi:hypothetical protein
MQEIKLAAMSIAQDMATASDVKKIANGAKLQIHTESGGIVTYETNDSQQLLRKDAGTTWIVAEYVSAFSTATGTTLDVRATITIDYHGTTRTVYLELGKP